MSLIKNLTPKALLNDAKQLGQKALGEVKNAAQAELVKHLGETYVAHPQMPAYTQLPAAQLQAAKSRSGNATQPLTVIQDPHGRMQEPVSIEVAATKGQLQR